jgi:beta-galactosidase
MPSKLADFRTQHIYLGWYGKNTDPWSFWQFKPTGYMTETGAGGVVTVHCDYSAARHLTDHYEPEEYQQLVAESRFQLAFRQNQGKLGMFTWWCMRDITDHKYKGAVGINTKGLLTYAGDKKDIYYLYRCFLRPDVPTVHITSKRYFLREGKVDNGIKAYSNARALTLTLDGETVSTLQNGQYMQPNGRKVDNVFYWPVPLHTGRNVAKVSDDAGHADATVIYFFGKGGLPALPDKPLVVDLKTSNPENRAYYMEEPVQAQWPIYYDLDSNADNSFDELPKAIDGASWIAARRWTRKGQDGDLRFTLTRPATVMVMATKQQSAPTFLSDAGFTAVAPSGSAPSDAVPSEAAQPGGDAGGSAGELKSGDLKWRDNNENLVPAELYSLTAEAGRAIQIKGADRDFVVLLKEDAGM